MGEIPVVDKSVKFRRKGLATAFIPECLGDPSTHKCHWIGVDESWRQIHRQCAYRECK